MKPEHLTSWQPNADFEKLNKFIEQNSTLLMLLEEAWEKFDKLYVQNPPKPQREYAQDVTIDQLEHLPITPAEMAQFLDLFDKNREHNDSEIRPFERELAKKSQSQDPNWEILDN